MEHFALGHLLSGYNIFLFFYDLFLSPSGETVYLQITVLV